MRLTLMPAARLILPVVLCLVLLGCRAREDAVETAWPSVADSELQLPPSPPTQDVDSRALEAGDHVFAVRHDGRNRSYIVHVPVGANRQPAVVIALHGGGGTGEAFQEQNGLDDVADREGFIAVYPEGTGVLPNRLHTWNSGETCCGYALDRDVDDVGFLRAMIEELDDRTGVDRGRVYMTGHSNGAMMAYRFAAEASEFVTAIVPVGGAVDLQDPRPSTAVAVLHIHSVDDPRAIYEGGEGPPFPGTDRTVHHEPVLAGIEAWAESIGCEAAPKTEAVAVEVDERADRLTWHGCAGGNRVEHLRLAGSGHGWPGVAVPRVWQRHLGPATTMVNASEEVWAFVSQFSR